MSPWQAYVTYGRAQRRAPLGVLVVAAVALFGIAACGKLGLGGGSDEMSWARAALERNDRVEIVAVDPATNTFTVRIKETGDLRTVRADQVVAGPPGAPVSTAGTPAGAATMPPAPGASPEAPAGGVSTVFRNVQRARKPPRQNVTSQNPPAPGTAMTAAIPSHSPDASKRRLLLIRRRLDREIRQPRTGFPTGEPGTCSDVQSPRAKSATNAAAGSVLASGPGYSIKASGSERAVLLAPFRARHVCCLDENAGRAPARSHHLPGRAPFTY